MPQYSENIMGIDHPALAAKNLEVMVKWYCRCLNYKVLVCKENDGAILVAPDKTFLEIMAANGDSTPERKNKTPGFSHLAIRVHNLKQAVADGKKMGIVFETDNDIPALGGGSLRNFSDPEGNVLQFVER